MCVSVCVVYCVLQRWHIFWQYISCQDDTSFDRVLVCVYLFVLCTVYYKDGTSFGSTFLVNMTHLSTGCLCVCVSVCVVVYCVLQRWHIFWPYISCQDDTSFDRVFVCVYLFLLLCTAANFWQYISCKGDTSFDRLCLCVCTICVCVSICVCVLTLSVATLF